MMMLLLMAGIGAFLGGVVAILFGIPVKEFSFGNTLIVVGAMAACTGLIMIGISVVVGELKMIARRLGSRVAVEGRPRPDSAPAGLDTGDDDFVLQDDSDFEPARPPVLPPVRNGGNDSRARQNGLSEPEPLETAPVPKTRRNLMFASASRKERERAQARPLDIPSPVAPTLPPMVEMSEPEPPSFDDSWLRPERLRPPDMPPQGRAGRAPPASAEPNVGASVRNADQQTVTVLKSGVVDGMAYSLYSDGSIEAQMPEGLMRFASIDELRAHLDLRPG